MSRARQPHQARQLRQPHPSRPPQQPRELSQANQLRTSVLLAVSLSIAVASLSSILQGTEWWLLAFIVILIVFGSGAIARALVGRVWVGLPWAILAAIVTLTVMFASDTAILGIVPSIDSATQFGRLVSDANASITDQSIPAEATPAIQFLICAVVAGIAVVMDAVAVWGRAPAIAGVPLFVVVAVPSIVEPGIADAVYFALVALVYLVLLRPQSGRTQPALAISLGAVGLLATLLLPAVLPPVVPSNQPGLGSGLLTARINPIIDLGVDLRRPQATLVLTYVTTAPDGLYLRLTSLDTFDGRQWAPSTALAPDGNLVSQIGKPPGLTAAVKTAPAATTVSIKNAVGKWLPVPYPVTSVTGLTGRWSWEARGLSIVTADSDMRGQEYTVSSLQVQPTAAELAAAPRSEHDALAKVPAGLDPIVAATAKQVVGSASTDFAKAVALENWFQSSAFSYSETAPVKQGYDGSGIDVIPAFLKAKSGYCVHFASTMAVMARTLGIPSRVVVGFVPGVATALPNGTGSQFQVTSRDLHAWPELYFEGIGWVQFEPTPGHGNVPQFSAGATNNPNPSNSNSPAPTATARPVPSATPSRGGTALPGSASDGTGVARALAGTWQTTALGLAILAVLLLVPAALRVVQRARRYRAVRLGDAPARTAWLEVVATARDLGIESSPTATPREIVAALRLGAGAGPRGRAAADAGAGAGAGAGRGRAAAGGGVHGPAGPSAGARAPADATDVPAGRLREEPLTDSLERLRERLEREAFAVRHVSEPDTTPTVPAPTVPAPISPTAPTARTTQAAPPTAVDSGTRAEILADTANAIAALRRGVPFVRRVRGALAPISVFDVSRVTRSAKTR